MPFMNTWNANTEKGKKRVEKLLEIVRKLRYRDELRVAIQQEPVLRGIKYQAVKQMLRRECEQQPLTSLGKAWSKVPLKPNIALRLFPDSKRRQQFVKDASEKITVEKLEELYPEIKGIGPDVRFEVFSHLGAKRPFSGMAALLGSRSAKEKPVTVTPITSRNWWTFWPKDKAGAWKTELLADWRSDYRITGQTNLDYFENKWKERGCPNEDGLKYAARAFEETRNRIEIGAGHRAVSQVEKQIEMRMGELIERGILNTEVGVDGLYARLLEEFQKDSENLSTTFTKEQFYFLLAKILWTDSSVSALTEIIRRDMPLEKFTQYHPYIPMAMVEKKAAWLRGITNKVSPPPVLPTPTIPGVNRIVGEEAMKRWSDFKLPETSFANPSEISVLGKNWDIIVINGANIGLKHDPIIKANVVRRALAEAKYCKAEAIIMANMLHIETYKAAGPSGITRKLMSGFTGTDLDLLDPNYQKLVRDQATRNPERDRVIYVTREENLKQAMRGINKIFFAPDDEENPRETFPEYDGPIYISWGPLDSMLINAATYWHCAHIVKIDQAEAQAELGAATSAYRGARKQLHKLESRRARLEARLEAHPDGGNTRTELEEVNADIQGLTSRIQVLQEEIAILTALFQRTVISHVSDSDWVRYRNKAIGHIAELFESIVPNARIMSLGDINYRIGAETLKLRVPGHLRVTDTHIAEFH